MDRRTMRTGWVKYGLLVVLVAAGGAGGLYLSGGWPGARSPVAPVIQDGGGPDIGPSSALQRFPLTALDAKDTVEAPDLAADPTGRLFLTWASKTGESERTVFLTRQADAGRPFEAPRAISTGGVYKSSSRTEGKAMGYERRASPHVAVAGDQLLLTWSEARPDQSGMRLLLATSTDGGATFGPPRPVHQGDRANPTFTALAVGPGGAAACAWLDDRAGCQQPFAALRPGGADRFVEERLVYPGGEGKGVCPCCPTAACFAPDGTLYVAFRNVQDGYRDTAVARLRPGQSTFEGPFPVVANVWKFDGCPHDGPSVAVAGGALHVVWMDAHTGPQRCYYARANLADLKFEVRELHPAGPGTQGNARLFADARGGLHVVWEESLGAEPADAPAGHQHGPPKVGSGSGRVIQYAYLAPGQAAFGPARPVAPKPGAFQTRPTLVGAPGGDVWLAWNELDEAGKAVVVAREDRP